RRGARPEEPARAAAAVDRRIEARLPGGRTGARGLTPADRPARPGDAAVDADDPVPRSVSAGADGVLREHRGGDAGGGSGHEAALPAHDEPAEPGEPRGVSEASADQPPEPVHAAERVRQP